MNQPFHMKPGLQHTHYVATCAHLDDARCLQPLNVAVEDFFGWNDQARTQAAERAILSALESTLRQMFTAAGWKGDGELGCILVPPCLVRGGNSSNTVLYHVKQSSHGLSFLAVPHGFTLADEVGESTHQQQSALSLVSKIDFPHLRDGGGWMQRDQGGRPASLDRACFYAEQLRDLGMKDADVGCLLSDLYWDTAAEMDLRAKAQAAPTSMVPVPSDARLQLAAGILAGLLASGRCHETVLVSGEKVSEIRTYDVGEDWKEEGQRRRHQSECVDQAADLLEELEDELRLRRTSEPSTTN